MGKASKKKRQQELQAESILNGKSLISSDISSKGSLFTKPLVHFFVIAILGFLVYSNTFNAPFHFDDTPNIVENYRLRDLNNFWPPSSSRWFGFLTFALNYYFGGLNTIGYHIVNLAIHIMNAILVYLLVVFTFRTPFFSSQSPQATRRGEQSTIVNQQKQTLIYPFTYLPLFIALLFVSHPIQTQAVTYIVQRFTSLAVFFYLLSLVMYIKFRSQKSEVSDQQKLPAMRYVLYAVSLVSAVLAMKTKEISFTLPVIIVLYEVMFFEGHIKKRMLYLIPMLLTMLIIPLSLIGIDKPIGDAIGELREAAQETEAISRWSYLFTQFRVIVTYIRLLFFPINQNLDYDYPLYHSFFEPEVFLSFLFLLLIFAFGIYLLYAKRYTLRPTRLVSFGIFWFFITLSVESSIIPIRDVIFEHRLYLPVIGIIIVFVSATVYILQAMIPNPKRSLATCYLLLATAVIALSVATYQRNTVWRDGISLWEDVVRKSPEKARGYNNLGRDGYYKQGLLDRAIQLYLTALKLKPNFIFAHNNLGTVYGKKGLLDEAVKEFQIALTLKPDYPEVYNNLGITFMDKGLTDKAIEHYQIALRLKPDFPEAHNNLGEAYSYKRKTDRAIEHYQAALRLKPDYHDAYNNLANAYNEKGWIDKAIEHYQTALRLKPDYPGIHYNLGIAYEKKGLLDEAIREYQQALRLTPEFKEARDNLNRLLRMK